MSSILQLSTILWFISQLTGCSSAYELHDTIHTLKAENLHLQHRLENLTWALRDLEHLLMEHSRVSGEHDSAEVLHIWKEWSQHGISAETHHTLTQTLCLTELRGSAQHTFITPAFIFILLLLLLLLSPVVSTNLLL